MADINAGSFSADGYQSWGIGPDTPLASSAGGSGVSNPSNPISTDAPGLAVTAISGCSSPSIAGASFADAVSTIIGAAVNVLCTVSLTSTATTAVFDITVPAGTTANFPDTGQANGIAVVTSGTSGGSLVSFASQSATQKVRVTLTLGSSSGTYTANLAFSYAIN